MQAVLDGIERSNFGMSVWQRCKKRKAFFDNGDGQRDLHVNEEGQIAFMSLR